MKLSEIQKTFTRHIRDPENFPQPQDVEDRRMGIYRDLLFKNVDNFISNSFPVLRKITPDDRWNRMIRDYFRVHEAKTPLFPKMPKEFLQYLKLERIHEKEDFPFLYELACYEWAELELSLDVREISSVDLDTGVDLLDSVPVPNELVITLTCKYPVHRISPDFIPGRPPAEQTYLVVYRDRKHEIGFLELNSVSARLFELIQKNNDKTGRGLLQKIAEELQHPDPDVVIDGGVQVMQSMLDKEILLGTKILSGSE